MTEREETDFRVLRALSHQPDLSQRQIAQRAGISLGAVNFCLKALAEKGLVKVQNFKASNNKLRYSYVLTPHGAQTKARLALAFLTRKIEEYERLRQEIADVIQENESSNPQNLSVRNLLSTAQVKKQVDIT